MKGCWGFHHRVDCWMKGKQPWRLPDGIWEYPLLGEVMREDRLEEVETCITRIQNTFTQYIVMQTILDLC